MKKIILGLGILVSLSGFSAQTQNYKVEIQPTVSIVKNEITTANKQIEDEVKKMFSKEKMINMMNTMAGKIGIENNVQDEDFAKITSKMLDTMYKYYKIEIQKIDYVSPTKAYVKVKVGMPMPDISKLIDDSEDMFGSISKEFENMKEEFEKKNGGKSMEEFFENIDENDDKAFEGFMDIMVDFQSSYMEKILKKSADEGKYIGQYQILEVNKKGNKWIADEIMFGF